MDNQPDFVFWVEDVDDLLQGDRAIDEAPVAGALGAVARVVDADHLPPVFCGLRVARDLLDLVQYLVLPDGIAGVGYEDVANFVGELGLALDLAILYNIGT